MKSLRTILENNVVDFPTAIAKRKKVVAGDGNVHTLPGGTVDAHEALEADLSRNVSNFRNKGHVIDHASKLLNHMRDNMGLTLMQKGIPDNTHDFVADLVSVSKGARQAKAKGARFGSFPNHGVYLGQGHTGSFEDGYSGNTGIRVKRGVTPDEMEHHFLNNSHYHKPKKP